MSDRIGVATGVAASGFAVFIGWSIGTSGPRCGDGNRRTARAVANGRAAGGRSVHRQSVHNGCNGQTGRHARTAHAEDLPMDTDCEALRAEIKTLQKEFEGLDPGERGRDAHPRYRELRRTIEELRAKAASDCGLASEETELPRHIASDWRAG